MTFLLLCTSNKTLLDAGHYKLYVIKHLVLLSLFKECESLCCQEFNLLVNQLDIFKLYF